MSHFHPELLDDEKYKLLQFTHPPKVFFVPLTPLHQSVAFLLPERRHKFADVLTWENMNGFVEFISGHSPLTLTRHDNCTLRN